MYFPREREREPRRFSRLTRGRVIKRRGLGGFLCKSVKKSLTSMQNRRLIRRVKWDASFETSENYRPWKRKLIKTKEERPIRNREPSTSRRTDGRTDGGRFFAILSSHEGRGRGEFSLSSSDYIPLTPIPVPPRSTRYYFCLKCTRLRTG